MSCILLQPNTDLLLHRKHLQPSASSAGTAEGQVVGQHHTGGVGVHAGRDYQATGRVGRRAGAEDHNQGLVGGGKQGGR